MNPGMREQLQQLAEHLEHVLPGQAPIKDFVHHNTLHGFQQQPFAEALKNARAVTGHSGYLPDEHFRQFHANGRIDDSDLRAVLAEHAELQADVYLDDALSLSRADVYLAVLLHPLHGLTPCELSWQIEEGDALTRLQEDVDSASRAQLLDAAEGDEAAVVTDLWAAVLQGLDLEHLLLHPEEIIDPSPEQASAWREAATGESGEQASQALLERAVRREGELGIRQLLSRVGEDLTLGAALGQLSGEDLLQQLRSTLIRHLAAHLDQGMAAWHNPDRERGFYAAWRSSAGRDPGWLFEDLPDWQDTVTSLPSDATDAVIHMLQRMGIPQDRWGGYLKRLALELPGWSGMFLQRHRRADEGDTSVAMMDYLAVRLVLEQLYARRLCAKLWQIEPNLDLLRWQFRRHPAEFVVRQALYSAQLPEYLLHRTHHLVDGSEIDWQGLARAILTWRQSPAAERPDRHTVYRSGWQLFRLAQHLGLSGARLRALGEDGIEALFDCLARLADDDVRGQLWLEAYERHYREEIFTALAGNRGRGPWVERDSRPSAQVTFCMDDREESIRRHLEELNPDIETLGAAGFFGVAINWQGLDDEAVTPLCPVVVTPAHTIVERPDDEQAADTRHHIRRHRQRLRLKDLLHQETRRNLLASTAGILLTAPAALAALTAKLIQPRRLAGLAGTLTTAFEGRPATHAAVTAEGEQLHKVASIADNRFGFTDAEQADRVENFLRSMGLTSGFAPLVVLLGHGSSSQNNPHLAAYDCGACSGRHGGPNARVFATIANRPEVRKLLAERGLHIPGDTWFVGGEHDTCDDDIILYDLQRLPASCQDALAKLQVDLEQAKGLSAHERCRRFACAPPDPSPDEALGHVADRAADFSQARPELGHATNAVALIGRRAVSRGAFFDRRAFMISYDPTQDADGRIVEAILLAAGPVGAGINLEYYFSTVNNDGYGCGSKVVHNVTGLMAVMEGASSDLRTGLPLQMIEIHEAMRLLVVVEAKTATLSEIYQRQPPLQELVGNGWLLLAAIDPDDGSIHRFDPAQGWLAWHGDGDALPVVERSGDWYRDQHDPLPPALIRRSAIDGGAHHA